MATLELSDQDMKDLALGRAVRAMIGESGRKCQVLVDQDERCGDPGRPAVTGVTFYGVCSRHLPSVRGSHFLVERS